MYSVCPLCLRAYVRACMQLAGRTGDQVVDATKWNPFGWGASAAHATSTSSSAAAPHGPATHGSGGNQGLSDELASELAGAGQQASRAAADPIGLLVQLTALRSRSKATFTSIKLSALLLLRLFARDRPCRVRLVVEGAGSALSEVANDAGYDGATRAAAAAMWMEVGCSCRSGMLAQCTAAPFFRCQAPAHQGLGTGLGHMLAL